MVKCKASAIHMFNSAHVSSINHVLFRLSEMGQHVGIRMVDLLVLRERGFKREIKLLSVLIFIKANLWKVNEKCLFI